MKRVIAFRQIELQFTCGYLSAKNHVATMHPSVSRDGQLELFFWVMSTALEQILPNWRKKISFRL